MDYIWKSETGLFESIKPNETDKNVRAYEDKNLLEELRGMYIRLNQYFYNNKAGVYNYTDAEILEVLELNDCRKTSLCKPKCTAAKHCLAWYKKKTKNSFMKCKLYKPEHYITSEKQNFKFFH